MHTWAYGHLAAYIHACIHVCVCVCAYMRLCTFCNNPPSPSIELASLALAPSIEKLPTLMHKYKYF